MVADIAGYAAWLVQQHDSDLAFEAARLYAAPDTVERDLHLALLHGMRTSAGYDPELSARLLLQIVTREPPDSVHGQLAQILFAAQPDPQACREAQRLTELSAQLATELTDARIHGKDMRTQLETMRQELHTARNERARLESQLKALKSLEEQIKGRDQPELE